MKNFHCDSCQHPIYFENDQCLQCHHPLGYLPDSNSMSALEAAADHHWKALAAPAQGSRYRMCRNYQEFQTCNWMIPEDDPEALCVACRLNQMIPNVSQPENKALWYRLECAKRRLLYTLHTLGLPVIDRQTDSQNGLAFVFMADADPDLLDSEQVVTGHAQGLITINIAEADDAFREQRRLDMNERYRTVLGHFRHEIGHYYWQQLVANHGWLTSFRQLFGDERENYDQALQRYYQQGPQAEWQQSHISAYASSHPWEDWAETWAHYLHIVDTLETAQAVGLALTDSAASNDHFQTLIRNWLSLTYSVNSINRSMGLKDLYPFILCPLVIKKLEFIDDIIHKQSVKMGL